MNPAAPVRIDKWLWAVRLYKTRSLAAAACDSGHVRIGEQRVKPSRGVKIGDVIAAANNEITRTVKVVALLDKRVGAKLVGNYMEDLTPASEFEKRREPGYHTVPLRPKGVGRPTKKERRQWNAFEF